MADYRDPRAVFEETLYQLGVENPRILAVSCDSAKGAGLGKFTAAFPARSVEVGIAEQSAVGICAGLALRGFIPVVAAITPFITMRCYEQLRDDVGYVNGNVKIVGSGAGLAYSTLGSTHEAIEDIAVMKSIPNMMIMNPGDAFEIDAVLRAAISHHGPVYIRMPRQKCPDLVPPDRRICRLGKAEYLRSGSDAAILTSGTMGTEALAAAKLLEQEGIHTAVVNFPVLRPIDKIAVQKAAVRARLLVTLEEHSVSGGMGSTVAEILASMQDLHAPLLKMGIPEGAKATGSYEALLSCYRLTGAAVAETIKTTLRASL